MASKINRKHATANEDPADGTTAAINEASLDQGVSKGAVTSDMIETAGPGRRTRPRPSSKLGIVLGLLEMPDGATLAKLMAVTGWLPHTTRAALTGLRKRGFVVTSQKEAGHGHGPASVYRSSLRKRSER